MTGLQICPVFHDKGMPLGTLSDWGWHTFPNPQGYRYEEVLADHESHGKIFLRTSGGVTIPSLEVSSLHPIRKAAR